MKTGSQCISFLLIGIIAILMISCQKDQPTNYQPTKILSYTQQGNKLVGTGSIPFTSQGCSVSISADGNTIIMGGEKDNSDNGAVWFFTRTDEVWTQQGTKLFGTGAALNYNGKGPASQGAAVAISADGNTAIVGGYADNYCWGAAWIFTRNNNDTWSQQGPKLFCSSTTTNKNPNQGFSVAISADGNTAIIGGPGDQLNRGSAWIFRRTNGVWAQQGNALFGTDYSGNTQQGISVGISGDGNTVVIGGWCDNSQTGAAWVFTCINGSWIQQGNKLVGKGAVGKAYQGYSVSMSADGNSFIVGGYKDNNGIGAAWIFTRTDGTWTQQGDKLVGTGAVGNANQGTSVAMSGDGNYVAIGGAGDNNQQGAVWTFGLIDGVWTQIGTKMVGTGNIGAAQQGNSVSMSGNGTTIVAGGYYDANYLGAGWVWCSN